MGTNRLRALCTLIACALAAAGLAACGAGSGGSGSGKSISIWEGYTGAEQQEFTRLVAAYEKANPGVKVNVLQVNNDNTLQKVLTAVRGGTQPDIAYLYGSWAPNIAKIPLVDNLAVVYNKTLFAQAGLTPPAANWTWSQFQADAKALTKPAIKQYGTAYVTPGSEDTVWHWEVLLWEAGGQILNASNTKAAFNSPAGLASLNTLRTMAVTDHSMYLDPTDSPYANLFNSGKVGMLVTGPWDLSAFNHVHYGVQVMPEFPGTGGGHQTIAGPDNWALFNNGAAQVSAAEKFVLWLTAPAQAKAFSLATGDLPIRQSVAKAPGFTSQMNTALPGVDTFIANLGNVRQARPQIATYPQISQVLGPMIVSVLLGKSQPKAALDQAAAKVNSILAGSGS